MPADITQLLSENDANTESTVGIPTEEMQRMMHERRSPISGHSHSDLTGMAHSGLQEFFVRRDSVPQTPGIDQLDLIPRLRLVFEQPAEGGNQSLGQLETGDHQHPYWILGVVYSRAEIRNAFSINGINLAVSFVPWGDDAFIYNESIKRVVLASTPEEFNILELRPGKRATIYPGIWELRGENNTVVQFRLRPRRCLLFLEKESNKRAAGQDVSQVRGTRFSRGWRQIPQRWYEDGSPRNATSDLSPVRHSNVVNRPVTTEGAAVLAQVGLDENSTLSVVDETTGRLEYSITRDKTRVMKRNKRVDVYKALFRPEDGTSQPQLVVVKMYKRGDSAESAMQYWDQEHSVHRSLRHRCIPSLVSFDSRLLALMIEYKDCGDLGSKQWSFRRAPGEALCFRGNVEDACTILADISSALAYIAKEGIVHNDIKATNILYGGRGTPVGAILIDFGLSRKVEQDPEDEGGGSPWYIAPEYPNHEREAPADVWSLGVVMLYAMGKIPLPEGEPEWKIHHATHGITEAVAMRQAWNSKVKSQRQKLDAPVDCNKERKLRSLVSSMLTEIAFRISAHEVEEATKEWTS